MMKRMIVVAGIVLAVAACGDDGNDLAGVEDEAPRIQVVAVSETPDAQAEPDESHDDSADAAVNGMNETSATDSESVESDHDATESAGESNHDVAQPDHDETTAGEVDVTTPTSAAPEPDEVDVTTPASAASEPDEGYVVEVAMVEFGYQLDRDTVPAGEPVTFRFTNEGQIEHEAMFGSMHQQEEFASSEGHGDHGSEGHHGEIAAITLDAEDAGEMVMVFEEPGEVLMGCHLPGHWDAGMVASFEVVEA